MTPNRRIVITGGPGSGKSTLIGLLKRAGHVTEPEAGRTIIREQTASGGDALPWADRVAFAERMAASDMAAHARHANAGGPVFFDRGLPDVAGYLSLCDLPVPIDLRRAVEHMRYANPVFIAPFWLDIFAQDGERRQDADEAERTCEVMWTTYTELGYRLVELPLDTPEGRLAFILEILGRA